jgi:hypothetical protein
MLEQQIAKLMQVGETPVSDRWGCVDGYLMHPYEGVIRRDNLPVCLDKPPLCTQGGSVWPLPSVEMEVCDSKVILCDEFTAYKPLASSPRKSLHQNAPLADFLKRTEVRRANGRDESPRLDVLWV